MLPVDSSSAPRTYTPPPPPVSTRTTTGYAAPAHVPSGTHLSDTQVRAESQRILDVGDRTMWGDDLDARARAFSEAMGGLDADSAQRLFRQVTSDDRGAMSSWLTGDKVFAQTADPAQRAAVVNAYAHTYALGQGGDMFDALNFLSGGRGSALLEGGPGIMSGALKQVDDMLAAGDTRTTDSLRQDLGTALLQRYGTQEGRAYNPAAAAYAVHLMSGSSDPTMTGRAFGALPPDQRSQVFQGLNDFGLTFARGGEADPMVQLVNSVTTTGGYGLYRTSDGQTYRELGIELVRDASAGDHSALFPEGNEHTDPARASAFSSMLLSSRDEILNTMLDTRDMAFDPANPDGQSTLVGEDGVALANLMRATALDSDNPRQQAVLTSLSDYVGDQQALARSGDPADHDLAVIRLGGFAAVTTDAVTQLQSDITADREANAAVVSFLVDTALSAVPGGGAFGGSAEKALTEVLGDSVMSRLAGSVTGEIVDQATGKLTDDAKARLTEMLGPDGEAVLDKTTLSNDLHRAIYAGAEQRGDVNDINAAFTTMRTAITYGRDGG